MQTVDRFYEPSTDANKIYYSRNPPLPLTYSHHLLIILIQYSNSSCQEFTQILLLRASLLEVRSELVKPASKLQPVVTLNERDENPPLQVKLIPTHFTRSVVLLAQFLRCHVQNLENPETPKILRGA